MLLGLLLLLLVVVILLMFLRALSSGARDAAKGIDIFTGQANRLNDWLTKKQAEQRARSVTTREWIQGKRSPRSASGISAISFRMGGKPAGIASATAV